MYKLSSNDFLRSAISAVFVAVVVGLAGIVGQAGFDVFATDWIAIGKLVVNMALATFVGRLAEKFISDKDGRVLGTIG